MDHLVVKNTDHKDQNDLIAIMPLELELQLPMKWKSHIVSRSQKEMSEILLLFTWIQLDFLHKTGTHHKTFDIKKV